MCVCVCVCGVCVCVSHYIYALSLSFKYRYNDPMLQNILFQINAVLLNFSGQRILKTAQMISTFIIIRMPQICILEWFLKDHVILKTGVVAA